MPMRRGGNPLKKGQHLAAPKLLANDDLLSRVDPMNLKHVRAAVP